MGRKLTYLLATASLLPLQVAGAHAQDAATRLETIVVEGESETPRKGDRYVVSRTTTATKGATPVESTPQSTTSVSRKQMDDQNAQTVQSALNYTAGVLSNVDENSRFDSLSIRGFGGFFSAMRTVDYLDGLRLPRGQAWGIPQIDPFLLDRIDVLKGPSAVLYGQGSPGGLVNQISTMPSADPSHELRLETGSHGRVQAGVRSRGALSEDGVLQYSFSAIGRQSGTRHDDVDEQRLAVAPALTWQPDEDTSLTLLGFYQKDPEGGYFNHIYPRFLAPAAYRPYLTGGLNVGDPSYDSYDRDQFGIGYIFEHRFNDAVKVGSRLRYGGLDSTFRTLQISGPLTPDGLLPRWAAHSAESVRGVSADNNVELSFATAALEHKVLVGIDVQRSTSDFLFLLGGAQPLDVTNPQYGLPVGPFATFTDAKQDLRQTGIYLQDQMTLGNLHILLGGRYDWSREGSLNRLTGVERNQRERAASYRAGLLYEFDNGIAPYLSYSTSFEPVVGVGSDGRPFVPTEAEQFEIGVKYSPDSLDAIFTLAAFDIKQKNVLTPGPVPGFSIQQGGVRSRGIEFEARGSVTDNLELITAVTLLETEISRSNAVPSIVGNRPQGVPRYFGSLWANYTFDDDVFDGLSVGAGVRIVGSSYADDANAVRTPGYALVDAAVRYDLGAANAAFKGAEATLNVTNLFDRDYYSGCSNGFYCQVGKGREVVAGLRYRW